MRPILMQLASCGQLVFDVSLNTAARKKQECMEKESKDNQWKCL